MYDGLISRALVEIIRLVERMDEYAEAILFHFSVRFPLDDPVSYTFVLIADFLALTCAVIASAQARVEDGLCDRLPDKGR